MVSLMLAATALCSYAPDRTTYCFRKMQQIQASCHIELTITPLDNGVWIVGHGGVNAFAVLSTANIMGDGLPDVEPCVDETSTSSIPQSDPPPGGSLLPGSYSAHVFKAPYQSLGTWAAAELSIDEATVFGRFVLSRDEWVYHRPAGNPPYNCMFGGINTVFGYGKGVATSGRQASKGHITQGKVTLRSAIINASMWPQACEERSSQTLQQYLHQRVVITDTADDVEQSFVIFDGLLLARSDGTYVRMGDFAREEFEPFVTSDGLEIDGELPFTHTTTVDSNGDGAYSYLTTTTVPSSGSGVQGDPLGNENVDGDVNGQICWNDRIVLLQRLGSEIGDLAYSVLGDLDLDGDIDIDDLYLFNAVACNADWNCDGEVDSVDFLDYFDAYGSEEAEADMNGDFEVDILDLLDFIDAFAVGC